MTLPDKLIAEMTAWRHHLHAHPETAYEEKATGDFVAARLAEFGFAVDRGLAGTGVVGTLRNGEGGALGLRADMDALFIPEATGLPHASTVPGTMHACGHDGHMAMLLGAACHLAATRNFAGTLHVIFQPAEENEAGGRRMVEDGLFERFPVDAVYGLHNWPQMPVGRFAVRPGPVMAACDLFEIIVTGKGAHGAMPHQGIDPVVAAAHIVTGLQTIASRLTDPIEPVVVTVTRIHGGDTWNVIPDKVTLAGTARAFRPEIQDQIEAAIRRIAEQTASAHGARAEVGYIRRYPPTINHAREAEIAARVAEKIFGTEKVSRDAPPSLGAEDFAFMLDKKAGAYAWIGSGGEGAALLHNPRYDFNDAVLPLGAAYWVGLAESVLKVTRT